MERLWLLPRYAGIFSDPEKLGRPCVLAASRSNLRIFAATADSLTGVPMEACFAETCRTSCLSIWLLESYNLEAWTGSFQPSWDFPAHTQLPLWHKGVPILQSDWHQVCKLAGGAVYWRDWNAGFTAHLLVANPCGQVLLVKMLDRSTVASSSKHSLEHFKVFNKVVLQKCSDASETLRSPTLGFGIWVAGRLSMSRMLMLLVVLVTPGEDVYAELNSLFTLLDRLAFSTSDLHTKIVKLTSC